MVRKAAKIIRDTWAHSICQGNWHSMLRHNTCRGGDTWKTTWPLTGQAKWHHEGRWVNTPLSLKTPPWTGAEQLVVNLYWSTANVNLIVDGGQIPHCIQRCQGNHSSRHLAFFSCLMRQQRGRKYMDYRTFKISFNLTSTFTQEDISNNTESEFVAHNSHT